MARPERLFAAYRGESLAALGTKFAERICPTRGERQRLIERGVRVVELPDHNRVVAMRARKADAVRLN